MRSSELECALLALDEITAQRDEARRAVETLTTELEMWRDGNIMAESHRDEIAQLERTAEVTYENHKRIVAELTSQRDEARREVCALEADTIEDQREYAKQRGWNCFGQNTCKEAHNEETNKDPG